MQEIVTDIPAIVLLPLGILAAWALAEWRRRRRLETFGDVSLLGISARWPPRILAAALVAAALTATAVIVLAPPQERAEANAGADSCAILIDGWPLAGSPAAPAHGRESLERAVEAVIGEGEGVRFSVHAVESELRQVVPETVDRQAILLMMQGFLPDGSRAMPGALRRCIEELCERTPAPTARRKIVVVSARAADELIDELGTSSGCRITALRLARNVAPPEFGAPAAGGVWSWSNDPGVLRRFLEERETVDSKNGRPFGVPHLAGLALILAAAERILTLVVPLYTKS